MNHIFFKLASKVLLTDILSFLRIDANEFERINHLNNINFKTFEILEFSSLDNLKKNTLSFMSKKIVSSKVG